MNNAIIERNRKQWAAVRDEINDIARMVAIRRIKQIDNGNNGLPPFMSEAAWQYLNAHRVHFEIIVNAWMTAPDLFINVPCNPLPDTSWIDKV